MQKKVIIENSKKIFLLANTFVFSAVYLILDHETNLTLVCSFHSLALHFESSSELPIEHSELVGGEEDVRGDVDGFASADECSILHHAQVGIDD